MVRVVIRTVSKGYVQRIESVDAPHVAIEIIHKDGTLEKLTLHDEEPKTIVEKLLSKYEI